MRISRIPILTVVMALLGTAGSGRTGARDQQDDGPPEQRRMGVALFREGLKQRGLTDLLELHLKDFPPQSAVEVLLMQREVKIAESRNSSLDLERRRRSLAEADDLLRRAIEESPNDPRRFEWLLALGRSLLYGRAVPYSTAILYLSGTQDDREKLRPLTERAVETARSLARRLRSEYDRIDRMSAEQFEALETSGVLDILDRIAPEADYLLIWSLFYDAIARDPKDPLRTSELHEVLSLLMQRPAVLRTPQDQNPVQIPALLVAGMSQRRLNDLHSARDYFDRARSAYDRIADSSEKKRTRQAVTLAEIESVRNDRDDGRWQAAQNALDRFKTLIDETEVDHPMDPFVLRMCHALLARSLNLKRAETAARLGRAEESDAIRATAWMPLSDLALAIPRRRSELYATVYRHHDPKAHWTELDPFEQVARVVQLVNEKKSQQAIDAAGIFLEGVDSPRQVLIPEVLYQVALAHHQRGRLMQASASFRRVAADYSRWPDALRSAELAVQLGYEAHRRADPARRDASRNAYSAALETLLEKFPDASQSAYWRFFCGQLRLAEGDPGRAAELLDTIRPDHPHYLESLALRVRATARQLEVAVREDRKPSALMEIKEELLADYEYLSARCDELRLRRDRDESADTPANLQSEALVTSCQALILPHVAEYRRALDMLEHFEKRYPRQERLLARVWRVRLMAYAALEEVEEVARSISEYVASDLDGAGNTLQGLYDATAREFGGLRDSDDGARAPKKAAIALELAKQLSEWARETEAPPPPQTRRKIAVQLAEAHLHAGEVDRAYDLFGRLAPTTLNARSELTEVDARALLGRAEALRQRGDCEQALLVFNQLATGLSPKLPMRWEALLGDLSCRTTLSHPPAGIIQVIKQQKFLHPQMGGATLARRFDRLLKVNAARASSQESP